jgi:hypothetical protein
MLLLILCVSAVLSSPSLSDDCAGPLDCSLNGLCVAGACVCDSPWSGHACTELSFAVTPISGKSLYDLSDPRNTWNGPIVVDEVGKFHMFAPLYVEGSLGKVIDILHGVASVVTGPYDWHSQPSLNLSCENPAALVFPDPSTGALTYSLWVCGDVLTASSPSGTFVKSGSYPGGNPAPVFHNGAFYLTNQKTTQIFVAPALGAAWTIFGNISDSNLPTDDYHVEDPFLWVDHRGNWHIINHAYSNMQFTSCGSSYVSAHWFSEDGKNWHWSDQPYTHTVFYDDGSNHTYTTLERPNLHFNAAGVITHINLAADMIVGDEGCENRTKHAHNGHTPCVSGRGSGRCLNATVPERANRRP